MASSLWRRLVERPGDPQTSPLSPIEDQKKSIHPPLSASNWQAWMAPVRAVTEHLVEQRHRPVERLDEVPVTDDDRAAAPRSPTSPRLG